MTKFHLVMDKTLALLDAAQVDYNEPLVYVAYSGGRDSAVVLDIAAKWSSAKRVPIRVMAIDTGLSADGWREMVSDHCKRVNVPLEFCKGDGYQWYRKNVANYGFGYTPTAHTVYYRRLKQEAIQSHLQSVKRHHRDRVVYLTGVRRDESARRANTQHFIRHGCRVTANVIAHWPDALVSAYLERVAKWHYNPFYGQLGNSGDCQCGWTCRNSLPDLNPYTDLHGKIAECQDLSLKNGFNAYGERMDFTPSASDNDNMPDDSLCAACMRGGDYPIKVEDDSMDKMTELNLRASELHAQMKKARTSAKRYNTRGKVHLREKWQKKAEYFRTELERVQSERLALWNKKVSGKRDT